MCSCCSLHPPLHPDNRNQMYELLNSGKHFRFLLGKILCFNLKIRCLDYLYFYTSVLNVNEYLIFSRGAVLCCHSVLDAPCMVYKDRLLTGKLITAFLVCLLLS